MNPGDRFKGWIDGLAASWKDRLRGWMASWVVGGMDSFLGGNEAEAIDLVHETLNKVREDPNLPPDIKVLIDKLQAGTQPLPVIIIVVLAAFMIIPMITSMSQPLGRLLEYAQDRLFRSARLDPMTVITAWRRDSATYNKFFDDLRELGWTDERIEALKFVTEVRPSPQEAISLMAHEAFEEGMVAKYGLDDEFEGLNFDYLATLGITKPTAKLHWRGHWQHASFNQVVEMYRRKLITKDDFSEWFRVVEIPPFWRDNLIEVSHAWPTRVDVRRWWDMRTIDETELRRLYEGMGYHGVNLDNYILWTKVYVAFPDLLARWQKGWITLDDVRSELTGLGMPAARLEEMIQTKIEAQVQEPINEGKKISQTAIIKWVKEAPTERWEQGVDLLMDLGYNEASARFIMEAYIAGMGSPETYQDWKVLTQGYRKAVGLPSKPVSAELLKAASELARATSEVETLREAVKAEQKELIDSDAIPAEAAIKRNEIRTALFRAESELSRIQTDYNILVARWKQQGKE